MDINQIIQILEEPGRLDRAIYIYTRYPNGDILLNHGDTEELVPYGASSSTIKPTLRLSHNQLQELANALDKQGFKPQKGFLEGELIATKKHLEDMRTLVFETETVITGTPKKE